MNDRVNKKRRRFLTNVTAAAWAVGGSVAAYPFIRSMTPSERAKAAGAPVVIDISRLEPGQMIKYEWRGKPIWVIRRTDDMVQKLADLAERLADPDSERSEQPDYAKNVHRSREPKFLVLIGVCTHLGCSPVTNFAIGPASGLGDDWPGGFFCPCHGSKFDLSGRVYKNLPAPTNLVVPPYKYLTDTLILVGEDDGGAV